MKCPTCGAPVHHAPPDGDLRYLPPPIQDIARAELAEAKAENFALAANQCHAPWSDEYGNHRCHIEDRLKETQAELERLKRSLVRSHSHEH